MSNIVNFPGKWKGHADELKALKQEQKEYRDESVQSVRRVIDSKVITGAMRILEAEQNIAGIAVMMIQRDDQGKAIFPQIIYSPYLNDSDEVIGTVGCVSKFHEAMNKALKCRRPEPSLDA